MNAKKSKNQEVVENDNFRANDVAVAEISTTPTNPLASKVTSKALIAQIKADADAKIKALRDAEKKAREEAKANKTPKERPLSAYGVAMNQMCKDPNLTFEGLKKLCAECGFTKESAIRTAHVTVKHIFNELKAYGWIS